MWSIFVRFSVPLDTPFIGKIFKFRSHLLDATGPFFDVVPTAPPRCHRTSLMLCRVSYAERKSSAAAASLAIALTTNMPVLSFFQFSCAEVDFTGVWSTFSM